LAIRVDDAKGRVVQNLEFAVDGTITFPLGNAPVLGMGEGADQFDRRGANYRVINGQRDRLAELGTRIFSPFLIGTSGWAMFIGTPNGGFDLREEKGAFKPDERNAQAKAGVFDLFVIDAKQPADAMSEYIRLTGAPALPPKWSLGYLQSHRTLSSEADVLAEAKLFRDRKLPCDAMIYLGTGFCPDGWNYGHDSFEFNKRVFKRTPAEIIKDLHDLNIKIALHIVPQSSAQGSAILYRSLHGQIPAAEGEEQDKLDINSYWKRHLDLFNAGVDGWWPDEGDWFDIPSRLARYRMYYQGPLNDRPNVRPWNLQRNGYCGTSQYAGWYWSGDIESSWKTLKAQVKVGQNASLSISPYWGTDIGGFYPARSKEYTGELYLRWFQFAAFCPLFRSHGRTWHLHTPWGWDTGETGPVESQPPPPESELHNANVEPICRDYLNLRYQLMPYTYTITRESRDTGMPMMRALWLHYPDDAEAVKRGDEYLWGRDMLVAPVTEAGATNREVYLPEGTWYDWWTNKPSTGKQTVQREVDLKTMPLFVRAGAIVPLDPVRQYVDEPVSEPTSMRIYSGADGKFVLYDDDGKSQDYLKGAGTWTEFSWNDGQKKLSIRPDKRTQIGQPQAREFEVVLLPDNVHKKVKFTGAPVEVSF
jgi:alpha-glucosidase/alpha-D-xyloside xylohydrolase